ncbi:MAG: hypothetical protein WBO74_00275 [Thermoanaerobaculia bacterium]
MGTLIKIWLPVSTLLAVLGLVPLTGLSAQEGSDAGELPAPIGFVEIDGVGRFDIHPVPEGMTSNDASNLITEGSKPVAYWHGGTTEGVGGKIIIFALPKTGDPTRSSVWVEFFLSDDRTELEMIQSRGITLNPRLSGIEYEWMQHFGPEVTLEELSVEGNGPMTLKLRFDGSATRIYSSDSAPPGGVPMKGVLEVTGLPYRPL